MGCFELDTDLFNNMPKPMEIIPDKRKLLELVSQANDGKLCLPHFQRSFVWKHEAIADLISSVIRGYYIGSLLLLRCDPAQAPFSPKKFRGADANDPAPDLLVLDGQQRITSLLYALKAPDLRLKDSKKPRRYFFDIQKLLKDITSSEIVVDLGVNELEGLDRLDVQYERLHIPLTTLLRPEDFMRWRDGLDDWLKANNPDEHAEYREHWREPWTRLMDKFRDFQVPLVELPMVKDSDDEAIGRVCAIFEKLNSTGVALSVYDLLTARLYGKTIDLHKLWDDACRINKKLAEWSERKAEKDNFGVLVLRTLALSRGLEPKAQTLINLKPEGFEEDWRRASSAVERALELLSLVSEDGFGVFDRKWLPGYGMIPVLAALRLTIDERGLGAKERDDLRRWYWSSVFLERYSSAVETKSKKDYSDILEYWKAGSEPSVFTEARTRLGTKGAYSLRNATSYSSSLYSGVFCLLAIDGARDWRVKEDIQLQKLDDHHIFPKAYLQRHGEYDNTQSKKARANTVLNRTLISNKTNNIIKAKAPAEYLLDENVFPPPSRELVLSTHFIDTEAIKLLEEAREVMPSEEVHTLYNLFIDHREALILDRIRVACGIPLVVNDTAIVNAS